ncbi:MAG: DUF3325 domain-containing protein [Pseudomonadota bacterium]
MALLVFLLLCVAVMALCLSMNRHHRQVFKETPGQTLRYGLRALGYGSLLVSAIVASHAYGLGVGLSLFTGLFTVAILLCAFAMTYLEAREP